MKIHAYKCQGCNIIIEWLDNKCCPLCKQSNNLISLVDANEAQTMLDFFERNIKLKNNYNIRMDVDDFIKFVKGNVNKSSYKQNQLAIILPFSGHIDSVSKSDNKMDYAPLKTESILLTKGYNEYKEPYWIIPILKII